MKKWLFLGLAVMVTAMAVLLAQPAVDPEDFTGEWYSATGQHIYLFQNGIIHCEQHSAALPDGSTFSGAYAFSGKSIALFAMGVDGLETVKELYLVQNKEGSLLCDHADGSGTIYFVRHK